MTIRSRVIGLAAIYGLAIGVAGCSTGGGGSPASSTAEPPEPEVGVQLEVVNQQRIEADIWVFLDGQRRRVGSVRSFSEDTFLIPMDRARRGRLEFRLFGGPTCVTRDISLLPGDELSYTIPMNITLMDAVCRGNS